MKFEEIKTSIFNTTNLYEENRGIKTLNAECRWKGENCAVFAAIKNDNTTTLFYARKGKRSDENSWSWFCPSDEELETLMPLLMGIYHLLNKINQKLRKE
jgi:hypothetical protein